ncbi:hypothetical protein K466DRAFT_504724, partial [Polyporus arcularius HHB13444]
LARDLWPGGSGRLVNDSEDIQNLPARRVVPAALEDMFSWLCVDSGCGSSANVWIHPDIADGRRVPVVLRLQGIVRQSLLTALGDWDGQREGAPKAMQRLTLTGSCYTDAFLPQLRAVDHIKTAVLQLMGRRGVQYNGDPNCIYLKRRVFTKVGPCTEPGLGVSLTPGEDPAGRAGRIRHMWYVEKRVQASVPQAGKLVRANPLTFQPGDLVDVAASVQAVTMQARGGRRTEVFLVPLHVVLLKRASEMEVSGAILSCFAITKAHSLQKLAAMMYTTVKTADQGQAEDLEFETGFESAEGNNTMQIE